MISALSKTLMEEFEESIQARDKSISKLQKKIAMFASSALVVEYQGMLKSLEDEQKLANRVYKRMVELGEV